MEFQYKTPPFPHQHKEFIEHGTDKARAILWEQGTGKTKVVIDEAAYLYQAREIDALFILAPNGLQINWVKYELPVHMSIPYKAHIFLTSKKRTKGHQQECEAIVQHQGLAILAMSYDAIMVEEGRQLAKRFLTKRRCLYVLDESNRIKSPGAKRTKRVLASAGYAKYKRILCGTPITNSPFDLYTQMKFLEEKFWDQPYGLRNFNLFKTFFGVWEKGYNRAIDKEYPILVAYQNMEVLKRLIAPIASRVLKEDVLDLPPKLYSYRFFEMTPKQRRLYNELEQEFMAFLDGELVTAPLAITRMMRLQQITCGYIPVDDPLNDEPEIDIDEANPRLALLHDILEDIEGKVIIWARYQADTQRICSLLGPAAVRYDGTVPSALREVSKERFLNDPSIQYIVAIPDAMGEGHTFVNAKTTIYYSNSFKLKERLQSEDRNHRIGQENQVLYLDLIAQDTIDLHIVEALKKKFDLASDVVDDRFREWLKEVC